MKANWRRGLYRLWIVGTLIWLVGAVVALRPDQQAARYLDYRHAEIGKTDTRTRQLVTLIRVHRINGLAPDEIKTKLLEGSDLTGDNADRMIELEMLLSAKGHAKRQFILFFAIALIPPLVLLGLGAALSWATRGLET